MRRCMRCMQEYDEQLSSCPECGYRTEDRILQRACHPETMDPEQILMGRYILGCFLKGDGFTNSYAAWDALLEKKVILGEYFPICCAERNPGEDTVHIKAYTGLNCFEYGRNAFEEESEKLIRNQEMNNTVPVYRLFREHETSFRVMEYEPGITLGEYLEKEKSIPLNRVNQIMSSLCRAVEEVHSRGILHCNLNPGSIFVDEDGNVKLTDFGYSKAQIQRLLADSCFTGLEYMAPEISSGEEVTQAADLFSLGMIGKQLFSKADGLTFRKRSSIRRALGRAVNENPLKRPAGAAAFAEMIT